MFGSEFLPPKRKEPSEVIRINAILAVILKANSHKSTGLHHPQKKWVLDKSDACWLWIA